MAIYNLGSINIDLFYSVPHLPAGGETIAATDHAKGLGGKGANQSVSASQAGSDVFHIGAIGPGGGWTLETLSRFGVNTDHVRTTTHETGHAVIVVDAEAENTIVLFQGANVEQSDAAVADALGGAKKGDLLLLQNETNLQVEAAKIARDKGMRVVYSAAPFSVQAVAAVLPYVDILVLNEVEAQQLHDGFGVVEGPEMIVTLGSKGALWRTPDGEEIKQGAFAVKAVDTTGAGDCFIGSVAAALDQGLPRKDALRYASGAAAIQVSRHGTAEAMPSRTQVQAFLADQ